MASRTSSRSTLRQCSTECPAKLTKSNPASRSSSPAVCNGRIAKLNLYLSRSIKKSTCSVVSPAEPVMALYHAKEAKRWDGNSRMTDPELWFGNGDCLVHLYERGGSRRGASLRISLADIEASNFRPLLDRYYAAASASSGAVSDSSRFLDVPEYCDDSSPPAKHDLYIPAPSNLTREEALHYHITTRNFFAWLYERPLVGHRLGQALISLQERLNQYRFDQEQNQDEMLAYLDNQGYTDFRDCPDHALAILHFAERFHYRELWTDAFVHCTGMNDDLGSSGEFLVSVKLLEARNAVELIDITGYFLFLLGIDHTGPARDGSSPRACGKIAEQLS
ncbi:MAG: hypothetical protein Q9163_005693 [Psora crenata]